MIQSVRQVGEASPVGFLALPVGESGKGRDTFIAQTKLIAAKLAELEAEEYAKAHSQHQDSELARQHVSGALPSLAAQVVVTDRVDQIVNAISARFDKALAEKNLYQKCLESLHAGEEIPKSAMDFITWAGLADETEFSQSTAYDYGVIWKHRLDRMIERHQLERLELAASGVQLFHEGWVAEYDPLERRDGPPAIRHVVLMHKSELNELCTVLNLVTARWSPQSLRVAWKEALDKVTGRDVSVSQDVSPLELMKKHFGIKVKAGLLALTLNELAQQDASNLIQARMAIEESYYRLLHILESQEADYFWEEIGNTGRKGFKFRNKRPRLYWWYGDEADELASEARAWIERDVLP